MVVIQSSKVLFCTSANDGQTSQFVQRSYRLVHIPLKRTGPTSLYHSSLFPIVLHTSTICECLFLVDLQAFSLFWLLFLKKKLFANGSSWQDFHFSACICSKLVLNLNLKWKSCQLEPEDRKVREVWKKKKRKKSTEKKSKAAAALLR